MKETAIIYCRKSTDREDRQTNSLEHQTNNCNNTIKKNNLLLLDEIQESISAKTGGKRAGFNRMIEKCNKLKVDYIVIDETKRLSRNMTDSALIITLLDTNKIKGILTTDKSFLANDISAKFMLLLELGMSKMDNEHRSKDIRGKMITALHKGQWLSKAIFGYRNVGPKGKKDIEVLENEAEIVLKAFIMRTQQKTLKEIAEFINEKSGTKWNSERVSKMLINTKYYGLQKFGGEEALLNSPGYRPIISKELFEKVNGITKVREYKKGDDLSRYFSGILYDTEGNKLYPYKTKGNIYYHQGVKTSYKINISQEQLFKEYEKYIDDYNFPKPFIALSKLTLKEYYKDKVNQRKSELSKITKELNQVNERLNSLLDKLLDNIINKETYDYKKKELENKKIELEEKYKALKQDDSNIINIIENLCKPVENLSDTYKTGNEQEKGKIIRALQCKLILDSKKQLTIKDSKLFEIIKSLNFIFGTPTANDFRTFLKHYDVIDNN